MANSEELEKLEKVRQLMVELGVDNWNVYCYVSAKEIQSTYENVEEHLAGWQEAESEQPSLVKDLSATIRQYL